MFTVESAKELLERAGVFFEDLEDFDNKLILNMNDTWAWASCDGEEVPEDSLPELAELFFRYGYCGILYWVGNS